MSDPGFDCLDEAFPTFYPCFFMSTSQYKKPDATYDISLNTGDMTLANQDEDDHPDYDNRYAVAAAWWDLKSTLGEDEIDLALYAALINLPLSNPPAVDYRHPRDFFNELLKDDDNDNDPTNGTPNLAKFRDAYKDHGMYYYPNVVSTKATGAMTNR